MALPQRHEGPSIWQKSMFDPPSVRFSTLTTFLLHSEVREQLFLWGDFLTSVFHVSLLRRMGALMGSGVGLTIGFLFGSWSIIRSALLRLSIVPTRQLTIHVELSQGVEQARAEPSRPFRNTC